MRRPFRKFTVHFDYCIFADSEKHTYVDEVASKQIGAAGILAKCFMIAERFAKQDKYFKRFEWKNFEQVSYMFHITEWNQAVIDGYNVPEIVASANMEEVLADYNGGTITDLMLYQR